MIRITHNGDMSEKIASAKEAMTHYHEVGTFFKEIVTNLSSKQWHMEDIQKFWLDVYGMLEEPVVINPQTEAEEKNYKKCVITMGTWADIYDSERDIAGDTAWNAANAVTNWIQHKTAKRGRKASLESRIDRNIFGKNAENTVKVMKAALQYK